ncbi:hemerythrin domain-containing protein [Bacteroidota bacterium]
MILPDMKMAEMIHLNYEFVSVINRFNIKLGFGDKTIHEVCEDNSVNIDFFLAIINAYYDNDYFPKEQLKSFPVNMITSYLKKNHEYYLFDKIPELESLIKKMILECYQKNHKSDLLDSFFTNYKEELIAHVSYEDEVVFPYALNVEKAYLSGKVTSEIKEQMKNYSIKTYLDKHDDVEEKLYDLKNIIIKYLPAPVNSFLCNKVLFELFYLEKDLDDHSMLEEKVLIPKVEEMEKSIFIRI